ncbi:hypothetical protein EDM59_01430 [Brevibacillus nitrificans]|uniref:Uncharacterized protein n=1 Tax=Brevibacillus nitrificans TaxID=651560 RepID=A0A3M8DPT8_9BACL|nr:hypothetical protein [Brevibacillus nitrificans]RNB90138.1 hypothetical protein EDM59_01430 [Brevibacillus nitrificans]
MEKTELVTRVEYLSDVVQENVIRIAEDAYSSIKIDNLFRYLDEENNVMYCASGSDEDFCVSVSDYRPELNVSALGLLINRFGEPHSLNVKESSLDPGLHIFYITWKRVIH